MLLVELCCEPDSTLGQRAPDGCMVLRVTAAVGLTDPATRRALHQLLSQCVAAVARAPLYSLHSWVPAEVPE